MERERFSKVGIVGLGLMGGSLARAIGRLPERPRVLAADRDRRVLDRALAHGVIDEIGDVSGLFESCDMIVLATPVRAAVDLLRSHHACLGPGAMVTDLGSVKRPIVEAAHSLGLGSRFVGGHPLAGDHRGGFDSARAALYDGARVWLTPLEPGAAPTASLMQFWRDIGAQPEVIDAAAHDRLMAWASHLPQITASALGRVLGAAGISPSNLGPGGRDTTRLAGSPTTLWTEILLDNADLLARPLAELIETLGVLATALGERDANTIGALLGDAVHWTESS